MSVSRTRLPSWRHSKYEPEDDANDLLMGAFAYLVLAPLFWFILPLIRAVCLLPIAIAHSLFSLTRWVEALCRDPAEIRIVWQTTRAAANEVAEEIARRLSRDYENLTPCKGGARLDDRTARIRRPLGMNRRDAGS